MERESGALTAVARTRLHGVVSYEPSTAVKYKCTYILYTCMYMAEYKEVHCNFITKVCIYWPKDGLVCDIYTTCSFFSVTFYHSLLSNSFHVSMQIQATRACCILPAIRTAHASILISLCANDNSCVCRVISVLYRHTL